jgi:threonine dehydrogenase-like Zn-dependent dehydrogenase
MKALVYTGVEMLAYQDVPDAAPAPGDALVAIAHVGICGSDMHAFLGHDARRPAPLILGHEAAGTVIAGPMTGTRVTINPLVTCQTCPACKAGRENLCPDRQIISIPPREGAFADRVAIPARNLSPVPQDFPTAKAALVEPLACGWHALRRAEPVLGRPIVGLRALVLGGGAIGLGAALVLVANGAQQVWIGETNSARRTVLERAGDFRVFDPAAESPAQVDLVIDGVGFANTRASACKAVRAGGVIVHIGLGGGEAGLDIRRMTLQDIAFIGSYTYTARDFRETVATLVEGRLGALDWPEIRPLSEGPRAFADIRSGAVAAPKIILQPDA